MILGDFIVHFNDANKVSAKKTKDVIEEFDLEQIIHEPTHKSGNTLDWVVIPKGGDSVKNVTVDSARRISDHFLITLDMFSD